MAMYFDYSVDEFYREYDKAVAEGSAVRMPDSRITPGVPVVALWFRDSPNLKNIIIPWLPSGSCRTNICGCSLPMWLWTGIWKTRPML